MTTIERINQKVELKRLHIWGMVVSSVLSPLAAGYIAFKQPSILPSADQLSSLESFKTESYKSFATKEEMTRVLNKLDQVLERVSEVGGQVNQISKRLR